jgi:hypothetical protein
MLNLQAYIMLSGVSIYNFYIQTKNIAKFDNIKGNLNKMKSDKTNILCQKRQK